VFKRGTNPNETAPILGVSTGRNVGYVDARRQLGAVDDGPTIEQRTPSDEQAGQDLYNRLQSKQITCDKLTDNDFEKLGEFYMGRMVGDSHDAMNQMMVQQMGETGERQMHIVMGKRLSGCDTNAQYASATGSMMGMLGGGSMMGWGSGWLSMLVFWIIIIGVVVALILLLARQSRQTPTHRPAPLDILKERYAKGEIDRKEFEGKRKDLQT